MDPAWIGVIGTGIGAAATGVGSAIKSGIDALSARGQRKHEAEQAAAQRQAVADEAKAQREAAAVEAEAQRKADAARAEAQRQADERDEQRRLIDAWRTGLATSSTEFAQWEAKHEVEKSRPLSMGRTPRPNILGADWFLTLRPHLLRTADGSMDEVMDDDDIQCDNETANVLSREIARLEREWLGTGNYRMPGRPPKWER